MSNARCSASLRGCFGPFFPDGLDKLMNLVFGGSTASGWGEDLTKDLPGHSHIVTTDKYTTDGYQWPHALIIRLGTEPSSSKVFVLFPRAGDDALSDGTNSDRSIAVYKRGACTPKDIDNIIAALIKAAEHR